jgi:esterase/lipase superfamily enzyme
MWGRMNRNNWHVFLVLCAVIVLGGCTLSNSLKPEPVNSVWRSDGAASRDVFFATDREPAGASFDLHWDATLRCGRTEVTIPAIAMPGQGPAVRAENCDNAAGLTAFARSLRDAARAQDCNSVLLVIHGYNATFATSLFRAGQLALDTQWRCVTLMFGWSSEGKFDRYAADIERSGYAVPDLIGLMRALNAAGLRVNVIAHSVGARMALGAAGALCEQHDGVVDQMILAAADISAEKDNDDFGHLLKRTGRCVKRTTLYASANDSALITSESLHGGVPRAGRVPLDDLQYRAGYGAVDVVDASLAPGDPAGHSYFTHSYEMARDMMGVLTGGPAAQRAAPDGPATLSCFDWEQSRCAVGGGRYVLAVTPERAAQVARPIRTIWPFIFLFR